MRNTEVVVDSGTMTLKEQVVLRCPRCQRKELLTTNTRKRKTHSISVEIKVKPSSEEGSKTFKFIDLCSHCFRELIDWCQRPPTSETSFDTDPHR
jgi:hypothetical protein